jgi:nucleotide-binding universal stress UspA family protein
LVHVVPKKDIPLEVQHYIRIEGITDSPEQIYYQRIGEGIIQAGLKEIKEKGVKDVDSFLLQGDPAEKITEFASERGVDMIVLGSRGLGGIRQMFLGSVSRAVCNVAACTCVTVKQKGAARNEKV